MSEVSTSYMSYIPELMSLTWPRVLSWAHPLAKMFQFEGAGDSPPPFPHRYKTVPPGSHEMDARDMIVAICSPCL
jgi:hypothetical protein